MAEQWEFLRLGVATVVTYSSTGYKIEKIKDFLRDRGGKGNNVNDTIPFILADGWEPLCGDEFVYATFKRPNV